jgi:hypothetical protein
MSTQSRYTIHLSFYSPSSFTKKGLIITCSLSVSVPLRFSSLLPSLGTYDFFLLIDNCKIVTLQKNFDNRPESYDSNRAKSCVFIVHKNVSCLSFGNHSYFNSLIFEADCEDLKYF